MPRPERPVDPAAGVVQRFAVELRGLRERAGSPGYRELARRAHYSATTLAQAARGDRLPSLQVTQAYVRACGGDPAEWEERWRTVAEEIDPSAIPRNGDDGSPDERPPYVGLAVFGPEDADRFFGRDRLVAKVVARLRRQRLVAVVGASGSGKSSLLRAGLLPVVESGLLITPGAHPLQECAVRIGAELGIAPGQLVTEFAEHRRNLGLAIRQLMATRPPDAELVLVVDQFEEVFTLCGDTEDRATFIAALLAAAHEPGSRTRVVLGLRADFFAHCAQHPQLADTLEDAQILVGPMTTDELRQAVTQPAIRAECAVETALVARLIGAATGQPGVLPLVSHALLETWRRRRGNTLTLAGYEATGGIHRAVARTAESVFADLDANRQRLARLLFLRLTALGEGTEDTKRRIARDELDDDPDTDVVLERLAGARLITVGHNSIELAHEALIRSWPRLRDCLADDREGLRVHRQLTKATNTWESFDRDPGALYRGARLTMARDWANSNGAALTRRERAFLDASVSAEASEQAVTRTRTRRLRQLVVLLTVLLVVAASATVYAGHAQRTATEQRDIALAHKVTAVAAALRTSNPSLAAQLGLAAYRLAPTVEARSGLLSTFATPYATRLTGHGGGVHAVAVSNDGRLLASGADDRTARVWNVADPHHPRELATLTDHPDRVRSVAFSPDGRILATAGDLGQLRLWDINDLRHPRKRAMVIDHGGPVMAVAFSPRDDVLATAGSDGVVRLWNAADPGGRYVPGILSGHSGSVNAVAFSPDGRTLASASDDKTVALWNVTDVRDPRRMAVLGGHRDRVRAVAFSPDGRTLATGGLDRSARLWDVADPNTAGELATLGGHTNTVYAVTFSPDGKTVATASADSTVRLWSLNDGRQPETTAIRSGHGNSVYAVAFSPDGRTLASASLDNTVRLEDLPGPTAVGHPDIVWSAVFSADGTTLATASDDGTARLWDVTDPYRQRKLITLPGHTAAVASVAMRQDGRALATASWDRFIRTWARDDPRKATALATAAGHQGRIFAATFSPDGRTLATASDDGTAWLWDVTDPLRPKPLVTLAGHRGAVYAAMFSPDGRTLATAGEDRTVRLWNLTDPSHPYVELAGHSNVVWSVAFSPDGRTLASAGEDNTVRLWDLGNPSAPPEIAVVTGHVATVHSVTFSPDGRTLASAGDDHSVRLWDVTDLRRPKATAVLSGHTDAIYSVAFSPDGHTLATASKDQTARLWETDVERVAARICAVASPTITDAEWRQHFPDLAYQPPCR